MVESREYTPEEVRNHFINEIRQCSYEILRDRKVRLEESVDRMVSKFLTVLDGDANTSGFMVIADPCIGDREYATMEGDNYYKPIEEMSKKDLRKHDITGKLHELWNNR